MTRLERSAGLLTIVVLLGACGARTMRGGRPDASVGPGSSDGRIAMPDHGIVVFDGPLLVDGGPQPFDMRPRPDRQRPRDGRLPDGPGSCTAQLGAFCAGPADCCPGLSCMYLDQATGICSVGCVEDDPQTELVDEDSCPDLMQQRCIGGNMGQSFCALRCDPALYKSPCPGPLACHPGSAVNYAHPDEAYCLLPKCQSGADCPIYVGVSCNPSDPSICTGALPGGMCIPGRGAGYECAMPGSCEPLSGLCAPQPGHPNATVGAPCKSDLDCGGAMFCERERNAAGRVAFRNGYCAIAGCGFPALAEYHCPQGATCLRLYPGGQCRKSCNLGDASSCRGNPADKYADYECYAWSNLYISDTQPVADAPVCDSPADPVYELFGQSPDVSCEFLGSYPGNSTNMAWRDPKTGAKAPQGSPGGTCLDDTASGAL